MSTIEQLIRARLGILALAAELQNVARACKLAGVSRSQFYAMKKAYETYGRDGLAPRVRRKPEMPNRTPAVLEDRILLNTRGNPTFSYIRLALEMKSQGISVSPTMIRYVWQRHGLSTRIARFEWVLRSNNDASGAETGDGQKGARKFSRSPIIPTKVAPSLESATGRKSFTGKDSGVDWNYWSQRVAESLTK